MGHLIECDHSGSVSAWYATGSCGGFGETSLLIHTSTKNGSREHDVGSFCGREHRRTHIIDALCLTTPPTTLATPEPRLAQT